LDAFYVFRRSSRLQSPQPCSQSFKGLIDPREYGVSVMAAFGYRANEPKRAKTRQAAGDVVQWVE